MSKKNARRDFLKKGGAIATGFTLGMFGGLKFNSKEGIRIGRENRVKFGMSEAHAMCGSSYDCSGGGGECGSSYGCAGEGSGGYGECGSSYDCSGGGGECGSSYGCSGS
jgi:hypothetical protein